VSVGVLLLANVILAVVAFRVITQLVPANASWAPFILYDDGEEVVYSEVPEWQYVAPRVAANAFLALGLGVFIIWILPTGYPRWIAAVGFCLVVDEAVYQLLLWHRTWYVLTDMRAIRSQGLFKRDLEWLSWKKVTEVSVRNSLIDTMFNMATIEIHTAHSSSSFKAMRDVEDPIAFANEIAALSLLPPN
jgi:membrane protein YdbS with pleckstrin-like domain